MMIIHTWHPGKIILAVVILLWFWVGFLASSAWLLLWMVFLTPVLLLLWVWFSRGEWTPIGGAEESEDSAKWRRTRRAARLLKEWNRRRMQGLMSKRSGSGDIAATRPSDLADASPQGNDGDDHSVWG